MPQSTTPGKGVLQSLDWITIGLYVALVTWGWFSVCGACYDYSHPDLLSPDTNSGKQIIWIGTSLILASALLFIEKRFYDTTAYVIYAAFILLLLVTIFIAPDTKGSRSWLPITSTVKLQPAEFAKFAVALALGKCMNTYGFTMRKTSHFLRLIGIIVLPMLLIVGQKETGSALVYLAFFLVLYREGMTGSLLFTAFACVTYFVIGVTYSDQYLPHQSVCVGELADLLLVWLFTAGMTRVFTRDSAATRAMLLGGAAAVTVGWLFAAYVIPFNFARVVLAVCLSQIAALAVLAIIRRSARYALVALFAILSTAFFYLSTTLLDHLAEHQRTRIEVLFGKKDDPHAAGYNVNQAKIAIGSGGLAGKGFLNGTQTKLKYVPEQHTDFIFCTVGEEEGFIGSAALLTVYLLFIWRLIALAERQPDTLGRVYGYSVCCIFTFHLFINVGMVLGLTPVIGIPLPFFSYGGSSLWGFTLLLFIFLRMDAERNLGHQA